MQHVCLIASKVPGLFSQMGLVNKSRTGQNFLDEPYLGSWNQEFLSGQASGAWNGREFGSCHDLRLSHETFPDCWIKNVFGIRGPSRLQSSVLAPVATSLLPFSIIFPTSSCQTDSFASAGPVPQGLLGSAPWPGKCSDWLGCGPDQMFHMLTLTPPPQCHTILGSPIFFFFSFFKKKTKCTSEPPPPHLPCSSLHIPRPGSCARAHAHSGPVLRRAQPISVLYWAKPLKRSYSCCKE